MPCNALWKDSVVRIGDSLSEQYLRRLDDEGLLEMARARSHQGEAGGASQEASDRHFACQFANSAARAVYVCIDPTDELEDVSKLIRQFFTDGRVLMVEVPCGSGAGTLGLLSAIFEERRSGCLPTSPLYVDVLGGDVSRRGPEHFESVLGELIPTLANQGISVTFRSQNWDALDIRSSSRLIDTVVEMSRHCDQTFLFVSNFSDALNDETLEEAFQHFLSQYSGRVSEPNSVCWVEPSSNRAEKILARFRQAISRLAKWLRLSGTPLISGVRYRFLDPASDVEVHSGVRVLKAGQAGVPDGH